MAVRVSVSPVGMMAGGIAGAIIRPALILPSVWPHLNADGRHFALMVSVLIGFGVGALAGLIGKTLISAVVGSSLALLAYCLTIWPMMACFCLTLLEHGESGDPPHWGLAALSGGLAGAVGGVAEKLSSLRDTPEKTAPPETLETSPNVDEDHS